MNVIILFSAVVLIFVAVFFAFYRVIYRHEKKHHIRHIVMLTLTSLTAWWTSGYFKQAIAFPRPDLTNALFLPQDVSSCGMPSGHAAFMFALATTMYSFDRKAGQILFMLAIITGVARVIAGVHYWYDIVGGALLGYVVSSIVVTICKRLIR